MLTLINTNRMVPAIGPIGLEYVAEAAARAGIEVSILDLALCEEPGARDEGCHGQGSQTRQIAFGDPQTRLAVNPERSAASEEHSQRVPKRDESRLGAHTSLAVAPGVAIPRAAVPPATTLCHPPGRGPRGEAVGARDALREHFKGRSPMLIGLSFRNVDDCFWPSAQWFVPPLAELVQQIRALSDAPIVVGGVGFSVFAQRIVEYTGVDFGIRGDGEAATVSLYRQLQNGRDFAKVPGLVWRHSGRVRSNEPAWPMDLSLPVRRNMIDNATYFARGGQCGFETKRGCNRQCLYCADPLSKGSVPRSRRPPEIADEIESLLGQGIDVLHTCDAEFNIPRSHAMAVCEELIRRSLGERVRWYAYLAVTPFDAEMAGAMRRAGCVGINFTGDSACEQMLRTYRQPHRRGDLANAVRLCRETGMKVMIDLMLGGPGETPQTVAETIDFIKTIDPDCAGTSLGIRIYPGTGMVDAVKAEGPLEANPGLRRKYTGQVDFFQPTFYVAPALGPEPARLIKDLIASDERFFEPMAEQLDAEATDHNYNDNTELADAIAAGARGAYWDILRLLRRKHKAPRGAETPNPKHQIPNKLK